MWIRHSTKHISYIFSCHVAVWAIIERPPIKNLFGGQMVRISDSDILFIFLLWIPWCRSSWIWDTSFNFDVQLLFTANFVAINIGSVFKMRLLVRRMYLGTYCTIIFFCCEFGCIVGGIMYRQLGFRNYFLICFYFLFREF